MLLKIFFILLLGCFKNFTKANYNLKGNSEIIKIFQDDLEILKSFLENLEEKDDINKLDSYGMSLIHYCILYGDLEKLEILLEKGANLNLKTSSGKNILLLCLERKELNNEKNIVNTPEASFFNKKILANIKREFVIHLIFKENFNTDFLYNNLTFEQYINKCYQISLKLKEKSVEALHDLYFYEDVLGYLEKKRIYESLNIYDKSLVEPLFSSLFNNDLESLKFHLNQFDKEEVKKIYFDNKNLLNAAIAGNLIEIVKFLIPYFNLNELQINEPQFIHNAVFFLRREILIEFLKAGADPNMLDFWKGTPLFNLCSHYSDHLKDNERKIMVIDNLYFIPFEDKIFEDILDILIEYGADINRVISNKFTCLNSAILRDNFKLVEMLFNRGAETSLKKIYLKNKNIKNLDVEDPIILAINRNNIEIVDMLMKKGADTSSLEFYNNLYSINPDSKMFETIIFNLKKLDSYPSLIEKKSTLLFNTLDYFTKNSSKNFNLKVIERLIKDFKEDVNYLDKNLAHRSCLQAAIQTRSNELVEILLKYGAKTKVNIKNSTFQPLSRAIMLGDLEIVKTLLKYGASPTPYSQEIYRGTPLMVAIERDEKDIVKELLKSGKTFLGNYEIIISAINHPNTLDLEDVYKKEIIPNDIFNSLLHLACIVSNYKAIRFLINNNHSPFEKCTKRSEFVLFNESSIQTEGVKHSKINLVTVNKDERAIDLAIRTSNLNAFSIMIEFYNDKNLEKLMEEFIKNNFIFGNKTLIINFEKGHYGIVKTLLKYDQFKDLNLDINYLDEGKTILNYAIEEDNKEFINLLKSYGALLSSEVKEKIKKIEKEQSLIFNILKGNLNKVKELLKENINKVLISDENNITPLTQSVISNNEKILNIIINTLKSINKLNVNIDRVDIDNKTALTYAIENKNFNIIKTLLENRANPNFRYARQYSYIIDLALDHSLESTKIIQILFDHKIKLNLKDIKFLFKNKDKINTLLLKLFKEEINEYKEFYSKEDKIKNKDIHINKVFIDKESLVNFNIMEKDNKKRLIDEIKKCLEGKKLSDSRDIVGYKPKFGEIRLINSLSSDRIFYTKKKNYLIIIGIYLNKRKRVLPVNVYDKASEKCKLYKSLISKNKIEELESYLEVLKLDD